MIPKQINAQDVKQAIEFVMINQVPPGRKSKGYDVIYDGEPFPPKYLISLAAKFSSYREFFHHGGFNSTEARNYLSKLNFEIRKKDQFESVVVIDDLILRSETGPTRRILGDLTKALKNLKLLPAERIKKLIEMSNRRDTPLIRMLKKLYDFKCQMPGCKAVIRMKNGDLYCEVAHIIPFSQILSSTIDNLIVFCPNHHKEFDHGKVEDLTLSKTIVSGKLNGKSFILKFIVL
jgi:hypothetical protein